MWSSRGVFGTRDQLLSVVYHSAADPGLSSLDVDEILATSRTWNRHRGITGLLLSENGRFLQALEGPEPEVRALMDRIQQDPRHRHVRILLEEAQDARRFPDWAMAHGHVAELETSPLAGYFETLLEARGELPEPATPMSRISAWFRGGPSPTGG